MTRNKKVVRLMATTLAATSLMTALPVNAAFDPDYYRAKNPDVAQSKFGKSVEGLKKHYETFGIKEGRAGSAADENTSALTFLRKMFDAKFYAEKNPDVVAVFGTDTDALFTHFVQFGMKEGRQINEYFDVKVYFESYPDLQENLGKDYSLLYAHFATFGQSEHRTLGGFPSEQLLPGGKKKVVYHASEAPAPRPKTVNEQVTDAVTAAGKAIDKSETAVESASKLATNLTNDFARLTSANGSVGKAVSAAAVASPDAVDLATDAIEDLTDLMNDATVALAQANVAKSSADKALTDAKAALAKAEKAASGVIAARAAVEEAKQNVSDANVAKGQVENVLAKLNAVKANDNKYYKAEDVDANGDAKANAVEVPSERCVAGLEAALNSAELTAANTHHTDVATLYADYETAKAELATAQSELAAANTELDNKRAEKVANQKAIVDAYNALQDDDEKADFIYHGDAATYDEDNFDFDTVLANNAEFAAWYASRVTIATVQAQEAMLDAFRDAYDEDDGITGADFDYFDLVNPEADQSLAYVLSKFNDWKNPENPANAANAALVLDAANKTSDAQAVYNAHDYLDIGFENWLIDGNEQYKSYAQEALDKYKTDVAADNAIASQQGVVNTKETNLSNKENALDVFENATTGLMPPVQAAQTDVDDILEEREGVEADLTEKEAALTEANNAFVSSVNALTAAEEVDSVATENLFAAEDAVKEAEENVANAEKAVSDIRDEITAIEGKTADMQTIIDTLSE